MDLFSLEVLNARSGDCLLVHYGTDERHLMLVDGGFASTYQDVLRPRLEALREGELGDGTTFEEVGDAPPLNIDLLIVSHLDADHIAGIERLFEQMREIELRGGQQEFRVRRLWCNSFDDAMQAATGQSLDLDVEQNLGEAKAASIAQARTVRDVARIFDIDRNPPFAGLVVGTRQVDLDGGATATVVAPTRQRLEALRREWESVSARPGPLPAVAAAAYVDTSVPNLSSIVVHLEFGSGTSMLLTGDGRGDHILEGLEAAGLTDADGRCSVTVLKLPHHGSDRTIDRDFFERIVADHYVCSGNGQNGNPSPQTFSMLTETQGDRAYSIWLTYDANTEVLDVDRRENHRNYQVHIRDRAKPSIVIDLGTTLAGTA